MSTAAGQSHAIARTPDPVLVDACVHCGFCLPSCPTYVLGQEEMDSPRGRLHLMRARIESRVPIDDTYAKYFDHCLGCLACVTACPSGVQYGTLITSARHEIDAVRKRPLADQLFRGLVFRLFPYPNRLRWALAPLVVWPALAPLIRRIGLLRLVPRRLRAMLEVAPPISFTGLTARTPAMTPSEGEARATVGLLTGCVQRIAFAHVNDATRRVLAADGCRVIAPSDQGCCGALSLHAGRLDEAREAARRTIDVFERAAVETVIANAAGCGSAMKEYAALLADDPEWVARARAFSTHVKDVAEFLDTIGPRARRQPLQLRVVYQDACHLAHAQGIRDAPRRVLASVPGVTILTPRDADLCCGSAGIYNLLEPEAASELGGRKAATLADVHGDVVASANPGCSLQIAAASRRAGRPLTVVHPIEIVDASIRGVPLEPKTKAT
jgi:glycolate oxidase iron-sulfur subunit